MVASCHLFTDEASLDELHWLARRIGMKPGWFRDVAVPHYDLTMMRRRAAVALGAREVGRREAVEIWRARRRRAFSVGSMAALDF